MVAIKAAIFVALVAITAWAGANLGYAAWVAYPRWAFVEIGGFIGCAYALTDLLVRRKEWLGWYQYSGPRRRYAGWGRRYE